MNIDKKSYQILKLLAEHQVLSAIDLQTLLPDQNLTISQYYLSSLFEKGFISYDTKDNDISVYSKSATYFITPDGESYIETKEVETKRFIVGSIIVPMCVAFITALATVTVAIKF